MSICNVRKTKQNYVSDRLIKKVTHNKLHDNEFCFFVAKYNLLKGKREERLVKLKKKALNFLNYHSVSLIKTSLLLVTVVYRYKLHFALHNFICNLFRLLLLNLNYLTPTQQNEKAFSRHETTVLFSRGTWFES